MTEPRPRQAYRTRRARTGSEPERALETQLIQAGIGGWERERLFHPVRRWRADFLFRADKLIVECDGAVYRQGRHVRGAGYTEDRIRDAEAVLLEYRVLRFTTAQVFDGTALRYIAAALGREFGGL